MLDKAVKGEIIVKKTIFLVVAAIGFTTSGLGKAHCPALCGGTGAE
ncbi:hypothetical protein GCM10025776_22070 [Corallincola platygyrae]